MPPRSWRSGRQTNTRRLSFRQNRDGRASFRAATSRCIHCKFSRARRAADAMPAPFADALLAGGHMQVHRLDADPPRTGKAVPDHVAAAAEDAGFQPEHLNVHTDAFIAIDPATRFDVDLLVLGQLLLEHVAVAVQPEDTFLVARAEAIDEESRGA